MRSERQAVNVRGLFAFCICTVLAGCATVQQGRHRGDALLLSSQDKDFAASLAHFTRGLLYEGESSRGAEKATQHYAQALELGARRPVLYARLAQCAVREADLGRAVAVLEEGCKACPDSAELHMELAATYQLVGRTDDAEAEYLVTLEKDSSQTYAYLAIALLNFSAGRDSDALDILDIGLRDSDDPRHLLRACHQQGARFLRAQALPRAVSCFEFVAQHEPAQSSEIYHIIGEVYRSQNDMEQARRYYTLATEADDPIPDAFIKLALLQHATNPQEAIQTLTAAITRIPGTPALLHLLGEMYRNAGRTEEAITSLTEATRQEPPLPQAFIGLAMLYLDDAPDKAMAIIEQAAERLPEHPTILLLLANMYSYRERFGDAVRIYERVADIAAHDTGIRLTQNFYLHYGGACERDGQTDRAERILSEGIEKHPDAHQMRNYLAYMWAEKAKHLDEALAHINHALELEPANGAYIDTLGWIYYQMERYPEALDQLQKAVGIVDDDPVLHEHLGDVLDKLGQTKEAEQHWRKSFLSDPTNKNAQERLKLLGVDTEALRLEAEDKKQDVDTQPDPGDSSRPAE